VTSSHATLLDLDARVFAGYLDELVGWTASLAPPPVRTVVDLGAGTGVGALALAARFPGADVVAVDRNAGALPRADRVRCVVADLDDGWPASVDRADVVWAS
jgi:tRNA1(Val) A37 N6-methylase TrmN6